MAGKKSDPEQYTKPELRDKIKDEVTAGDKGGRAGQWSARKAQLVAHEYEAEGGGYKHEKNKAQKNLTEWGEEHWKTQDGDKAVRGKETARYLPEKAWEALSPEERKETERRKRAGSRTGKQFVSNTEKANAARKKAEESDPDPGHKAGAASPRKAAGRTAAKKISAADKKALAKKAPAKKAAANKAPASATQRKAAAKQAPAKKAPAKGAAVKTSTKKAPAKATPANKQAGSPRPAVKKAPTKRRASSS